MVATRLTRWPVAVAALDVLRERPEMSGVQIVEGWPGKEVKAECIFLEEVESVIEYPNSSGTGRSQRDEFFTIPVQIRVGGNKPYSVGRNRVEELLGNVEDIFADFIVSVFQDIPGLQALEVSDPRSVVADTPIGVAAFGRIQIIGHSRLS